MLSTSAAPEAHHLSPIIGSGQVVPVNTLQALPPLPPEQESDLSLLTKQVLHDVRGDLIVLSATAMLLRRGRYGAMSAEAMDQLEGLQKRAEAAASSMADLCRLSLLAGSSSSVPTEPIDLRQDILLPVEKELADDFTARGIRLDCKAPRQRLRISGNRVLLQCVFRSLLRNALRYSKPDSAITCEMREQGRQIRIAVSNRGPVIPAHKRQDIFGKFVKAAPAVRDRSDAEGLGVGLYLARSIVRKHGGDIWYEAETAGSKFSLTLPAAT
ncbi:MAG: sensor histidine kinase [Thermodesulfobacteriota bacterium]